MNLSHRYKISLYAPFSAFSKAASWPTYSSMPCEADLKSAKKTINRFFSKFALLEKMLSFGQVLNQILKTMCKHMAEKSDLRNAKNEHFSKRMELRKRSNNQNLIKVR